MAEESDKDQRTEQATSKRVDEARERGQVPVSREVGTWAIFVAILLIIAFLGPKMAEDLTHSLRVFLERPEQFSLEGNGIQTALGQVMIQTGFATVIIFGLLLFAAIAGTMAQTGFLIAPDRLELHLEALLPMAGIKRLFSLNSLVELGKSFIKLVVLGTVVFFIMWPMVHELPFYAGHNLIEAMQFLHHYLIHLIVILMLIVTVVAISDLLYQRHKFFSDLRMTKHEIKEEYKQMEGDPKIKARVRQIRVEKARKRMMAKVPNADVIITNPTHYAVALQYDNKKMAAPVVLAKGLDLIALRIREVAEEHKIPLVSNPPLSRALYDTVEVDHPITPEHYRAVAEVISYIYKLKKKRT